MDRNNVDFACRMIEKTLEKTLPFSLRGIRITPKLVKAAIIILDAAPDKTLPQNCRNDIRDRTPDGLDRRLKTMLKTDLRMANIISDVLTEAGVAEIVKVTNPVTGRIVKGTKLISPDNWSQASKLAPRSVSFASSSRQVRGAFFKAGEEKVGGSINKEMYLRHLDDNIKASWLLKSLADQTTSRFSQLSQEPPLNMRLTAIQSALFMVGYDVINAGNKNGGDC